MRGVGRHPGALFESLVVVEALTSRTHRGLKHELCFFRDNNGMEIDLLQRRGRELIGVEIKSASTLHAKMRTGLVRFDENVTPLARKLLAYDAPAEARSGRRWSDAVEALDFRVFGEALAAAATS